jgi:hypothetical protein
MFNTKTLAVIVPSKGDAYVGRAISEGSFVVLRNARPIMNPGTKEGVTELHAGPADGTELGGAAPKLVFPFDQIVMAFPVEDDPAWQV